MSTVRPLAHVIPSQETSDGAGVKLRRSLGATQHLRLDPFLMLDEFGTENPDDYIAGFPPHPHRGFETVTYMLDGRMQHRDHLGNVGDLGPGGVQWMTAARGVIHSEMPLQEQGRMRGFQLWINLPAREKMKPAGYRDSPAAEIPRFEQAITAGHNAFVYAYEGEVTVGDGPAAKPLPSQAAGILGPGDRLVVTAGDRGARLIVLAARPLREPVVQYGPFVMNTREEIEQAIRDYQAGTLARAA